MTHPIKADPERQLCLFAQAEEPAEFCVRESRRARHLAVNVFPGGRVEIVAPVRCRPGEVQSFVLENRVWIQNAIERLKLPAGTDSRAVPARIGLPAIDQNWTLEHRNAGSARKRVHESGSTLYIAADPVDVPACQSLLRSWLKGKARRHLIPWLQELSRATGLNFRKVQIRGQRTRWGSFSGSGTVCLNYCLLFLPRQVVRYLLIHELCHTRYLNHSRRFWTLVRKYEPEYERLDHELNESWQYVPLWASPVG